MKRPENHIKEAESFAYVEDTLKEWVLNRLATDYGIDFDIQIFEQGEGTALNFGAQIKSTESSNMDATHYKFKLETRHINYFFKQNRPILLVVYYIPKKIAYWVVIQEYVWDILSKEKPNWSSQKSSTIKLPLKNVLTNKEEIKKAVRRCYSKIFFENLHTLFIDDGLGQYELLENPDWLTIDVGLSRAS